MHPATLALLRVAAVKKRRSDLRLRRSQSVVGLGDRVQVVGLRNCFIALEVFLRHQGSSTRVTILFTFRYHQGSVAVAKIDSQRHSLHFGSLAIGVCDESSLLPPSSYLTQVEAIASRLEAIASRLKAIAISLLVYSFSASPKSHVFPT